MKVKMLTTLCMLLIATAATAQQRRIVRMGGGPEGEDPTKDWPKIEARQSMSDAEMQATLTRYLDAMVARDLFSGTVLLARKGEPLFVKSYGLANKDWGIANANDTRYSIGSINKIFTKFALLQLRDAGKIDFSKTLRTYLPDYPSDVADRITIEQMLNHRSGLGDIFGTEYDALAKDRLRSLRDFLPLFVGKPLEFEPGTSQRYSNAGYVLLGLVIEKVSGMSYYDYVKTKIYAPAGMTDSDSYEMDAIVPKRAVGYVKGGRSNVYTKPARPSSAGGGYSTAMDLLRFTKALPKILGQKTFEREIGIGGGVGWGGGAPGLNAALEIEGDYVLIVLSNYDPPSASAVARNMRALIGAPPE